ncbi:MAG: inorganic diphosphatase [Spirochaetota bacterium]|nr:inorganic diphosphatase [Spirochaetota bacterium]
MFEMFIEAEAGSCDKHDYDEKTMEYRGCRTAVTPFPYPYGFILGTLTEEEDGVDCYLITGEPQTAGSTVQCEPVGLLEFFEGDETDHKVLAVPANSREEIDARVCSTLEKFIYTIWTKFPDAQVRVGNLLSRHEALEYIEKYRI